MKINCNRVLPVLVGSLLSTVAGSDESFRCGSTIIQPGMTQTEVRERCGDPTSETTEVQDVRSGNQVVGTTEVHRWTYESYRTTRVLIFDQQTLKSIE